MTFIQEIAALLASRHLGQMHKVLVVFNNRRPATYLRKELSLLNKESYFLQDIISMDDLVLRLGELEIIPNELLLFELYNIHKSIGDNNSQETIEQFIPLADALISDFSEIDLYMADAQKLFSNLHQLKAIGEWDIEGAPLTPFQKRYLQFYHSLYSYYSALREQLLSQKKAYSGMAYRQVAEDIDNLCHKLPFETIYFVGFNALSAAEKTIIKAFSRRGTGKFITDGDAYYVDNPIQEAGLFLRRLRDEGFVDTDSYVNHFEQSQKEINIVSSQGNVLQAKYAGNLLEQLASQEDNNNLENTAIVLADEKLLPAVLNSLPDCVSKANVSMGFPYDQCLVYSLSINILKLYINYRNGMYYHADIVNILKSPIISRLLEKTDKKNNIDIEQLFASKHIIRATGETVAQTCTDNNIDISPLSFLFAPKPPTVKEIPSTLRRTADTLSEQQVLRNVPQEEQALTCLHELADYFESMMERGAEMDTLTMFEKIYRRLAKRRKISLIGEPLAGLQILGMLEARNLDFDKVILLSANEGILPSRRNENGLIPLAMKKAFGLPTYKEKDAIYANHFYSLIQRASHCWIVYTTPTENMNKAEASRYVLQIEEELAPQYTDNIKVNHETIGFTAPELTDKTPDSETKKDGKLWERLLAKTTEEGLFPSPLNYYRACPMRYCYESLLKLREKEEVADTLDDSDLGNLVHKSLQEIYMPFVGKDVDINALKYNLQHVDDIIRSVGADLFEYGRTHDGRNLFYESIGTTMLQQALQKEINILESGQHRLKIIGCEQQLETTIPIIVKNTNGEERYQVKVKGIADRIDMLDGVLRIVDYKTGRVDAKKLKLKSSSLTDGEMDDKCFQVLLYGWIYMRECGTSPIMTGLYPLRMINEGFLPLTIDNDALITKESMSAFEDYLNSVLTSLMDSSKPLKYTESTEACSYCVMSGVCRFEKKKS